MIASRFVSRFYQRLPSHREKDTLTHTHSREANKSDEKKTTTTNDAKEDVVLLRYVTIILHFDDHETITLNLLSMRWFFLLLRLSFHFVFQRTQ